MGLVGFGGGVWGYNYAKAIISLARDSPMRRGRVVSSSSSAPSPDQATSSARWFAEEVHAHDSQLRSYLRGRFPWMRDVDDVVQESYLRTWRAIATGPIRSGKAFVFSVARRVAVDRLRRERVVSQVMAEHTEEVALEDTPMGADRLVERHRIELLGQAIAGLPARCREVVLLHKIDGMSQREVAEKLGISEKTVENHVANGVKRCEVFFRKHGH